MQPQPGFQEFGGRMDQLASRIGSDMLNQRVGRWPVLGPGKGVHALEQDLLGDEQRFVLMQRLGNRAFVEVTRWKRSVSPGTISKGLLGVARAVRGLWLRQWGG